MSKRRNQQQPGANKKQKQVKPPPDMHLVDLYPLRFTHGPSHRPDQSDLIKLPANAGFFLHGPQCGYLNTTGKLRIVHSAKYKDDPSKKFTLPGVEHEEELNEFWKSLNVNRNNKKFWKEQANKHMKYNRLGDDTEFNKRMLVAVRRFLSPGSELNLNDMLVDGCYKPGRSYSCENLVSYLYEKIGKDVMVTFRQTKTGLNEFYYLDHVVMLYDKQFEKIVDCPFRSVPESQVFYLEDMFERRGVPWLRDHYLLMEEQAHQMKAHSSLMMDFVDMEDDEAEVAELKDTAILMWEFADELISMVEKVFVEAGLIFSCTLKKRAKPQMENDLSDAVRRLRRMRHCLGRIRKEPF